MSAQKRKTIYRVQVALDAIPDNIYSQRSLQIAQKLIRQPEFARAVSAAFFVGFGGEVDTVRIMEAALRLGKRVAAPTTDTASRRLVWREVKDPEKEIDLGPLGLPEPVRTCKEVNPAEFELIAVPGTVWDEKGRRLSFYPGYFDRFLRPLHHPFKVGLAFDLQVVEDLSQFVSETLVDALITEDRVFRYGFTQSQDRENRRLPGGPMGYKG